MPQVSANTTARPNIYYMPRRLGLVVLMSLSFIGFLFQSGAGGGALPGAALLLIPLILVALITAAIW